MFIYHCFQLGTIGHLRRLQSTFMQDARVYPNVGFVKHLIQLEQKLKQKKPPT